MSAAVGPEAQVSENHSRPIKAGDNSAESPEGDLVTDPEQRARQICLNQLNHCARTRAQLESVLAKRGIPDDITAAVIGRLESVGLINDAEFADAWVRTRQRSKGLSRRLLETELHRAGVAREHIEDALAHVAPEDETAAAHAIAAKRARALINVEPEVAMRRVAGLLARKGYPPQVCFDIARSAVAEIAKATRN